MGNGGPRAQSQGMAELNQKQALRFYKPEHFPYKLPLLRVKFKHQSLNMNLYRLFSLSIHVPPPTLSPFHTPVYLQRSGSILLPSKAHFLPLARPKEAFL